jgi:hypothetical protein
MVGREEAFAQGLEASSTAFVEATADVIANLRLPVLAPVRLHSYKGFMRAWQLIILETCLPFTALPYWRRH